MVYLSENILLTVNMLNIGTLYYISLGIKQRFFPSKNLDPSYGSKFLGLF